MTEAKILKTDSPDLDAKVGYEVIDETEKALHVKMLLEIRTPLESGAGIYTITYAGKCSISKLRSDDVTYLVTKKEELRRLPLNLLSSEFDSIRDAMRKGGLDDDRHKVTF